MNSEHVRALRIFDRLEKLRITPEELETEGYFKFKALKKDADDSLCGILPKGGFVGLEEECEKAGWAALRCRSQHPQGTSGSKKLAHITSSSSLSDGPSHSDAEAARPNTPFSANWVDDLGIEAALQLAEEFLQPSKSEGETTADVLAALMPPQKDRRPSKQSVGSHVHSPQSRMSMVSPQSRTKSTPLALDKPEKKRKLTEDYSDADNESRRPTTADSVPGLPLIESADFVPAMLMLGKCSQRPATEPPRAAEQQKVQQAAFSLPAPRLGPGSSRCVSISDLLKNSGGFAARTWPSCRSASATALTVRSTRLAQQNVRGFNRSVSYGVLTAKH